MDIGVKKGKSTEIKDLDFKFFVSDGKLASTQTLARSGDFRSKFIDADTKTGANPIKHRLRRA